MIDVQGFKASALMTGYTERAERPRSGRLEAERYV